MSEQKPEVRHRARPRALNLDAQEGLIEVRRAVYNGGQQVGPESEYSAKVRVPIFDTEAARITVGGAVTKNLGDYNSAKVSVYISMPCYPEESEVRRVYGIVSAQVDGFLSRELDIAMGVINPDGTPGPNAGARA